MTAPQNPRSWSEPSHHRVRHVIGDNTLGWAIIGASAMARHHVVPAIRNQPPLAEEDVRYPVSGSHVVGVFSHDVARARLFTEDLQIAHAFVNLTDLLNRHDVHCVYVGGHPRHHATAALAALAAGKHVLCETPMALSLEDATSMAHTAASMGVQFGMHCVSRADPAIDTMRQMLVGREIGDILGARVTNMVLLEPALQTWRILPNGGGVIFNRSIHSVDTVRWLLRDEVASVYARSVLQILSNVVEEDVVSQLQMRRTGSIVEVRDSFLIPHNPTMVEVFGSAGTLVAQHVFVDGLDSELFLVQNQRRMSVPLQSADAYVETVRHFQDAVRGQGRPLAGAGDGLHNLTVTQAMRESIESGRVVAIPRASRHIDDQSVV